MPRLSGRVIQKVREGFLLDLAPKEICERSGIHKTQTIEILARRHGWHAEREKLRQEAEAKRREKLIEERARIDADYQRLGEKFRMAVEQHFRLVVDKDGKKRMLKISAKNLSLLAGALRQAAIVHRIAWGFEDRPESAAASAPTSITVSYSPLKAFCARLDEEERAEAPPVEVSITRGAVEPDPPPRPGA